jgi:hypothetical protein
MSNKIVLAVVAVLFIVMIGLTGGLFMIWTKLSATEAQAQNAVATEGQGQQMQERLPMILKIGCPRCGTTF